MVKPVDRVLAQTLSDALTGHHANVRPLPGIANALRKTVYIEQLLESIRRIRYISYLVNQNTPIEAGRADPANVIFDPLQAAVHHSRQGNLEEACWLVFLSVQFGKHLKKQWNLSRNVYLGDVTVGVWTWANVSANAAQFKIWVDNNKARLQATSPFGNHRKRESLSGHGTGETVASYVRWVTGKTNHAGLILEARTQQGGDPNAMFEYLYQSMDEVHRFGRTGKFDYLTMLGKMRLAPISPPSSCLIGSSGPLSGARLLFDNNSTSNTKAQILDGYLVELANSLNQFFGMQVLEDSLCNWQKSPDKFVWFRG